MRFIGFSFRKISVEKTSDSLKGVKLNTKINISSIEPVKAKTKEDEEIIRINFIYLIDYTPDIAKIELQGNVLLIANKKEIKSITKDWENKKMSEDFRILLFNIILRKSNVKALELEEEMHLPLHIPLPTLKKQEKKE